MVHHNVVNNNAKISRGYGRSFRLLVPCLLFCALLAGCSPIGGGGGGGGAPRSDTAVNQYAVDKPGKFAAGSSMKAIQDRGKLLVGLPLEIPPFAYEDPNTGSLQGFDVEIARLMANGVFGDQIEGKVEFIPLDARDRELALSQNKIDIALGRYPVTVSGKRFVDYAGPYFTAYQTVVAKTDRDNTDSVRSLTALNGRKICTVRGSTKADAILQQIPQADLSIEMNTVAECAAQVIAKKASGIAAEHIEMLPLSSQQNSDFVTLSTPSTIGVELYGIGVSKQKIDLRQFLNDRLARIVNDGRWSKAYSKSIPNGNDTPPPLERY